MAFSEGFRVGAAVRQSRGANKLRQRELRDQWASQTAEGVVGQREQTDTAISSMIEGISTAIKNGAKVDDPGVQATMLMIDNLVNIQTNLTNSAVQAALENGMSEQEAISLFGVPGTFAQNQISRLGGALSLAGLNTPEALAAAEGRGELASAMEMLGREPTPEERQRLAGVAPPASMVSLTLPPDEQESAFRKELGKADANVIASINEEAGRAREQLVEIERIKTALQSGNFETGVFADSRVYLARLFEFINVEPPSDIIGDAATADTLDAAAARLGIEVAQDMSRITNFSLQFVKDSLPQLTRTVEGNMILAEVMERAARRKVQLEKIANEYRKKGTLVPDDEDSYYDKINQLDREDPIIDDRLKQRIIEGGKGAPSSFRVFRNPFTPFLEKLPAGVPAGSTVAGKDSTGEKVYRTPEGRLVKPPQSNVN